MKKRGLTIALALTWDGARYPVRSLPKEARAFLATGKAAPSAAKMSQLFARNDVREIRVCWVPSLSGNAPMCEPFATRDEKRIPFRPVRQKRIGDCLSAVYRR